MNSNTAAVITFLIVAAVMIYKHEPVCVAPETPAPQIKAPVEPPAKSPTATRTINEPVSGEWGG